MDLEASEREKSLFPSSDESIDQRRQDHRRAVLWPAGLKIAGKPEIGCFVLDLSSGGALVRAKKPVAVGTYGKLRSQRFGREVEVIWSAGDFLGLRFTERAESLVKKFTPPDPSESSL
jgi:hypothetical protein